MTRHQAVIRCLKLVRQVPYGWMTQQRIRDLAHEHGVSTRTIYRDLDALKAAGYRVAPAPPREDRA